jgi:hypothetical protein
MALQRSAAADLANWRNIAPVLLGRHNLRCHSFVAAGDETAIQRAEQLVEAHDVELWCGVCFVARLAHSAK